MDDLISRQAAIDAVYKCTDIYINNLPVMVDKADAYKALAELPSAVKKGKWVQTIKHHKDDEQEYDYIEEHCSACGVRRKIGWRDAVYCPICGSYNGGEE